MKHNLKITLILLCMFFITQLIGLAVINAYLPRQISQVNETTGKLENVTMTPQLPYGMQPPEMKPEVSLYSIVVAFVIAILLIFLLSKIKATIFLRFWFFFVVVIAIGITLNSVVNYFGYISYTEVFVLLIALPLAFFKIFKRNLIVHNITELMIYPGIAAVFVPMLSIPTIIALLLIISAYDIYAVWHSGFMQKMAKFQIKELKLFAGFFLPYLTKRQKQKLKKLRKVRDKDGLNGKRMRVSLAILGGGDVVFPIITAGVVMKVLGFPEALLISIFSSLALFALFIFAKKGKFYPAMPFITAGCFLGMLAGLLV